MIEDFTSIIFRRIDEIKDDKIRIFTEGNINSMEYYKYVRGQFDCANEIREIIRDLFKQWCSSRNIGNTEAVSNANEKFEESDRIGKERRRFY